LRNTPDIMFYELGNPKICLFLGHKLNCLLSNLFFTAQALKTLPKDAAFIYQRYSMLNATGVFLSWWKKMPLILEFNSSEVWKEKHWHTNRRLRLTWLVRWFEHLNVRHADYIVVVSQPLKDMLIAQGVAAEKILVNPNGVDAVMFDSEALTEQRIQLRKQLGIEHKFVFGFIGTFSSWHGIDTLAAAIPDIVQKHANAHFLLIGDGQQRASLQGALKNIKDHVTFTGLVSPEKARNYLAACDACVLPTKPNIDGTPFFGSPVKLFEYMSMAKPVITTDIDQLRELFTPALRSDWHKVTHEIGVLIQPNAESFTRAAARLLELEENELKTLGCNARERVLRLYTWNQHVKKILTFTNHDQTN